MKSLKTVALGLMVGSMAISFSSFTNAKKLTPGQVFVNNGDGTYTAIDASAFDSSNCNPSTAQCAFLQTGGTFAGTINASVIAANPSDFTPEGSTLGVYQQ